LLVTLTLWFVITIFIFICVYPFPVFLWLQSGLFLVLCNWSRTLFQNPLREESLKLLWPLSLFLVSFPSSSEPPWSSVAIEAANPNLLTQSCPKTLLFVTESTELTPFVIVWISCFCYP
jgi:hypothetical protein